MEILPNNNHELATTTMIGQMANHVAGMSVFNNYREGKADNTTRRQRADLSLFTEYLAEKEQAFRDRNLYDNPNDWKDITWGLVEGFKNWMVNKSYAISTINFRLNTVKIYAELAHKATAGKAIGIEELTLIKGVKGYSRKEGANLNKKREERNIETRRGWKKSQWVSITKEQARLLKWQPNTPQGYRDQVIMGILLDHGLRVSELANLKVGDIDLTNNEMRFYRSKTNENHTHELKNGTLKAIKKYLEIADLAKDDYLLCGSDKHGNLTTPGMKVQNITKRVNVLGEAIGIDGLSAHDCRHYGATQLARGGTPIEKIKSWGGWKTYEMVDRYVESAKIANEGLTLGED